MRSGLCSVTFRQLAVGEVVRVAAEAGLQAIEWGGDVHVPPGDPAAAETARAATEQAKLVVSSYGSYYRVGGQENPSWDSVMRTAHALGTDLIRVWAGTVGSAQASPAYREEVIRELRDLCLQAESRGQRLALEFHAHTLTDTAQSTRNLLVSVARPNLTSYWQMTRGLPPAAQLASLEPVHPHLSHVHVHYLSEAGRHPLAEATFWPEVLRVAANAPGEHTALLEFVPGDDPAALPREAATLRGWLSA